MCPGFKTEQHIRNLIHRPDALMTDLTHITHPAVK